MGTYHIYIYNVNNMFREQKYQFYIKYPTETQEYFIFLRDFIFCLLALLYYGKFFHLIIINI